MLSFLPLAHMFERVIHAGLYMEGASIGFFNGDIRFLADDIKLLKPTLLPVVPRVLNRIYDKVMTEVNKKFVNRILFKSAIAIKSRELSKFDLIFI